MAAPSQSFTQELRRQLAQEERQRLDHFDPRALAWLALAPGWTDRLAAACDFPAPDGLEAFIAAAQAAGLAETEAQAGWLDFWMPAAARAETLAQLRQQPGLDFLAKEAAAAGRALLARRELAPQRSARWSELAGRLLGGPD
ncbi:MAG: hypothetical protein ACRDHL_15930, partial [Candidatus Promineifilaceae bacterium]